jgi:hypothetical protein
MEEFAVIEVAAAIGEAANRSNAEHSRVAGRETDVPLMRPRIVEAKREQLEMARSPIGLNGGEVGAPVTNFVRDRGSIHLDPLR